MLGESVLRHPHKEVIDDMFNSGQTAKEVAAWLRQTEKDRRLRVSSVSLQYYRKNFMKMSRQEIHAKRNEFQALGKHHDATALTTLTAAQDFIDAKDKQTAEVKKAISEFTDIKDEVKNAIKLIKEQTRDEAGNPIFVPRHYEIMEKMLGRLESANTSFIKATQDMEKSNRLESANTTTINIGQVQQESEVVKNAVKRILLEIDASKVTRFFDIYKEEAAKYAEMNGLPLANSLRIEINNNGGSNGNDTSINIITQLPTPEQADLDVRNISNENTTEHIVDIEPEPPQQN